MWRARVGLALHVVSMPRTPHLLAMASLFLPRAPRPATCRSRIEAAKGDPWAAVPRDQCSSGRRPCTSVDDVEPVTTRLTPCC